jgi:hypothetical protein
MNRRYLVPVVFYLTTLARYYPLKEKARRFLANFARSPCCESPFKNPRHLSELLGIRKLILNGAETIHFAVEISTTKRRCRVLTEDRVL